MPKQRVLWPSTVRLDPDYFDSLTKHAVPLDSRAVAALAHSALDLDIYAWLAQRLHRIPKGKPQTITWQALKSQFGPDYDRLRDFRRKFVPALKTVLTAYPSARIEIADAGLVLWNSPPPVLKKQVSMPRLNPLTIDATATEIHRHLTRWADPVIHGHLVTLITVTWSRSSTVTWSRPYNDTAS